MKASGPILAHELTCLLPSVRCRRWVRCGNARKFWSHRCSPMSQEYGDSYSCSSSLLASLPGGAGGWGIPENGLRVWLPGQVVGISGTDSILVT